jgi:hypothetical protein
MDRLIGTRTLLGLTPYELAIEAERIEAEHEAEVRARRSALRVVRNHDEETNPWLVFANSRAIVTP